jgi:choline-sulfatase
MNVLLITLDTTRADALGAYGAPGGSTPILDGLARDAIVFERAWTPVPLTLPAHASLLTGLYPRSHGVRRNGRFRLPANTPTLATVLRSAGYATAAFVSTAVLDRAYGLDAGFGLYDDLRGTKAVERRAPITASKAIDWLRSAPSQPFLLWVHFYDPHAPYEPPPALAERFSDPYAGEVALVDGEVGRLLETLDVEGLDYRTIVVVAGDHGEDRLQHGEPEHGVLLYETVLHVPLLVRVPARRDRGRREPARASLVDVCPTLLELLDISFPDPLQGRPLLLRSGAARPADHGVFAETTLPASTYGWSALDAYGRDSWKLVDGPFPELYDLASDPREKRDLASEQPDRVRELRAQLSKLRDVLRPPAADAAYRPGPAERESLAALGYVLGEAIAGAAPRSGPNPKSMVAVLPLLERGREALRAGRAQEAIAPLEAAARIDRKNPRVQDSLGVALHATGRLPEARGAFEVALATDPRNADVLTNLGATLEALGDPGGAENCYRNALAADPACLAARINLMLLLVDGGRFAEALSQAETADAMRPGLPLPLLVAGRCREALGDPAGARADYSRAMRAGEESAESLEALLLAAEAAYRLGDSERAESLAERATAQFPDAASEVEGRLAPWRDH